MGKEKLNVLELMHTLVNDYDTEISPNEVMILYAVQVKDKEMFTDIKDRCKSEYYFKESIEWLLRKDFLKNNTTERFVIKFDNLSISNTVVLNLVNLIDVSKKELPEEVSDLNTLTDLWYALWPQGVRPNGYLVRSGRSPVMKKLAKFRKEYPEFSDDVIIEATHQYIKRCSLKGYAYMKTASYFIYKDNESVLAGECERINSQPQQQETDKTISQADDSKIL